MPVTTGKTGEAFMMRVVLISGHDGASDRKTGFHFWAEILARRGVDVNFVTVGSSPISLLKKHAKPLKKPFNTWAPIGERIHKYTWMPIFHPLNFSKKVLNYITWPLFLLYPFLMPRKLLEPLRSASIFIIENGAGPLLVPRLAKLCPKARFIYNSSDRPGVVKFHPIIAQSEKAAIPYFDLIRVNSSAMASDFPPDAPVRYVPQAIDKSLFDFDYPNPYEGPRNIISVGDMLFDAPVIEQMANAYPDWTFHLFGKGARLTKPFDNVREYGEFPFKQLIPYIKFADIGLAPYFPAPQASYLSQSSLKLVQYTYCQLPVVAPDFVKGQPHIHTYDPKIGERSVLDALQRAMDYDRSSIDRNSVLNWNDVIDRMIEYASNKPINQAKRA
ncbi:MAG: hypothetical protein DI551_06860 [Micavibrio aeruginosavorus]|uniref:Glucuronosyltransferase GumK N-terminal domain-containing protein n=1 Tax=Micavibrio aeruginosavorus TaxID=349221 RepID=A0A2W5PT59_9BACT|nr:MAG: hypothetical protein DI551_06860 [Micavibrio aeruginosavorus]